MQKTNILLSTSVVLSPALNYNLLKNIKNKQTKKPKQLWRQPISCSMEGIPTWLQQYSTSVVIGTEKLKG